MYHSCSGDWGIALGKGAFMKNKIPEVLIAMAKMTPTEDLYTGDSFTVTEIVPGDKCNNGGEYGFTSVFTKTKVPGIYFWDRETTCDFSPCGTGPQGFVILTNPMVDRIITASERITDAALEAWQRYQWGDGDYPRYTGDSCASEIAAIISAGNS